MEGILSMNDSGEFQEKTETMHHPRLTAPEIANIWTQYQNDTMAICVCKYMIKIVEDRSIRSILELALNLAEKHIPKIKAFFSMDLLTRM